MTPQERTERAEKVIANIEAHPGQFAYDVVFGQRFQEITLVATPENIHPDVFLGKCDTVACFAGWTIATFAANLTLKHIFDWGVGLQSIFWKETARQLLGLTPWEAEQLFLNGSKYCETPESAIKYFRSFIEKVNQSRQEKINAANALNG